MALNWRKSVLTKKARRYSFLPLRLLLRRVESNNSEKGGPPVIANSFPKSGTNLLVQIMQGLPELRDWGLFLASTPSFTFKEIPSSILAKKIQTIANKELVGAHLFYSSEVKQALSDRGIVHYFIYRDPRDVVVSEAYYLSYMNRWHQMHKFFKQLKTTEERIQLAINGLNNQTSIYYPNIGERFERFRGWLNTQETFCLRYEDLISEHQPTLIRDIVRFYLTRTQEEWSEDALVTTALANIDPGSSHTFRKGESGGWREVFTQEHKDLFKHYAGNLLVDLGYEHDLDW